MGMQSAVPASVTNTGNGILWANPGNATGSGAGVSLGVVVVSFSITSNVVTFVTNPQSFIVGQSITVAGMFTGTYLNGATLTVLASGLTSTGFTANFTQADVASTYDSGSLVPTTTFASATNLAYVSLTTGQHALYMAGQDGPGDMGSNGSHKIGTVVFLASAVYSQTKGTSGVNGYPIGSPSAGSTSLPLAIPTLPSGSTVVAIYPYATGSVLVTGGGAALSFTYAYSGGSGSFALNGTQQLGASIGTNLSLIPSLVFTNAGLSTLETQSPYSFANAISDYGIVVVYTTTGTPIGATQLQTLTATQCGFAVASNAIITGVEVDFAAGVVFGSGTVSLSAQLTISGSRVGTTKSISTLGSWSTPYVLGGAGDTWGTALRGVAVNGSSGLGVDIDGTLPIGDQIDLNSLILKVYYIVPSVVVNINIGNTRPPTVGFN